MLYTNYPHPKKYQQLPGKKTLAGSNTSAIRTGFHQVYKAEEK